MISNILPTSVLCTAHSKPADIGKETNLEHKGMLMRNVKFLEGFQIGVRKWFYAVTFTRKNKNFKEI
jgi:hypothetical protein